MTDVWGFFYGGLINPDVMERLGMRPKAQELATVTGFEIHIAPLVNLVPEYGGVVHGLLLQLSHDEITNVYSQLKAVYLPYPVLASTPDGTTRPALCYMVPAMPTGQAEADHVMPLLIAAQDLGFPDAYVAKIRSFLPIAGSEVG
jgi:hypothetical protein